ncbi:hypothetical protein D9758_013388 [Tetrapyrgos nigripes]|uniref:Uncharacterized protein n=1 Tax=Tetrapyrgos nigripes TaxID=182062 RepID=A0A8H5CJA0_9AGAR|nr:hypothetical protein D9758_013388 [Tetrapyrgos nigripes]
MAMVLNGSKGPVKVRASAHLARVYGDSILMRLVDPKMVKSLMDGGMPLKLLGFLKNQGAKIPTLAHGKLGGVDLGEDWALSTDAEMD